MTRRAWARTLKRCGECRLEYCVDDCADDQTANATGNTEYSCPTVVDLFRRAALTACQNSGLWADFNAIIELFVIHGGNLLQKATVNQGVLAFWFAVENDTNLLRLRQKLHMVIVVGYGNVKL